MSPAKGSAADPGRDPELETLLEFLKGSRGFDFTAYKRTSLARRFAKRMEAVKVASYAEYLDHLQVQPDEFGELFDTLLINVTSFFRDEPAWRFVDEHVVPRLLEAAGDGRDLRVWSAGCASGQEAYSIAMLLLRALGEDAYRERVKIYATDVDDHALDEARHANYSAKQVEDVPEELLERCFERSNAGFTFRPDLRRAVIFGRNDLMQDAPISRIDLLLCRNTLMYFTAESQSQILGRFHFALRPSGFLFLGKSEMLLTHGQLFSPVDLKCRVFSKVSAGGPAERVPLMTGDGAGAVPPEEPQVRVREGAFDLSPVAQLVVDREGALAMVNARARSLFGLSPQDVGRPIQDLEVSYRPVELRSAIERAYAERRPVGLAAVRWTVPGTDAPVDLEVEVAPLLSDAGVHLGAAVLFADVTDQLHMRDELDRSRRELETAYEELQSTVEELETTNEELQSTNEELETTNEELQSTNEELETMNEELQSTNEELETINDELRDRTNDLNDLNAFLEGVLTSLGVGVAVVDHQGVVQMWNERADDLWGMRADEAMGQHFLHLEIGLPVDRVGGPLRQALAGDGVEPLMVEATNRRGQPIATRVTAIPLRPDGGATRGAIVLMEQLADAAELSRRGG